MTRKLLLVLVLAVVGSGCADKPPAMYRVTHANGKPCAEGFRLMPGFFTEGDGSHEDACFAAPDPSVRIDMRVRVVVDQRKPGESMQIVTPILFPR